MSHRACKCEVAHEARCAVVYASAVAGEHPFLLIDRDAAMRTCELMLDGTGRTRMSPDVWRSLMRWRGAHDLLCRFQPIRYEPLASGPLVWDINSYPRSGA